MPADDNFKEVDFAKYCKTCKHKDLKDWYDPCNDCLDEPFRVSTDKPLNYEEKEK